MLDGWIVSLSVPLRRNQERAMASFEARLLHQQVPGTVQSPITRWTSGQRSSTRLSIRWTVSQPPVPTPTGPVASSLSL